MRSGTHPHLRRRLALRAWGAAVVVLGAAFLLLSACSTSSAGATPTATQQPVTLTVFAASSLKAAFTKIGQQYQAAHPNVTVNFSFGGSDSLANQIDQGAPADVFASANIAQMNGVVSAGHVAASTVQTFAHNRLVVIVPKANPAHIQSLQDLAGPGIKLDLAAATVPAGQYAVTFLTKASADPSFGSSYKANVLKNVVSYETDVATVVNKVSLGEADAGIVYTTDAQSAVSTVTTIAIPDALNTIAVYPIAPVKGSHNAATASDFVSAVVSSAGQAVLASYGFLSGTAGPPYTPPAG